MKPTRKWYVKVTRLGCTTIQTLDSVIEEIRDAYDDAGNDRGSIELSFVKLSDEEYYKLEEFQGY